MAFFVVLTSITLHILSTNLAFDQNIDQNSTQNLTGLNIVEPHMTLNTDKGGQIVNNELIVLLKQPSQISPEEVKILVKAVTSL